MHSHFLNKFIKETLYFSGWKLFLNRSNNENVVTNVTSPLFKKKFCPHKILANFQCEGGGVGRNHGSDRYVAICSEGKSKMVFEISNFRAITLFKPHENIRKPLFLMFLWATERQH